MKKITLLVFVSLITLNLFSQMLNWTTPPQIIGMTTSTPVTTLINGAPNFQYGVANGAYDNSGNLLFYVSDYTVYSSNSTQIGLLSPFHDLLPEVAIVPVPGTCKQFYVIYGRSKNLGDASLHYVKIDCSTSTPVMITQNGTPWEIPNVFGVNSLGIAVSKIFSGSNGTAKRYLYAVGSFKLFKCEISSTGISAGIEIASDATLSLPNVNDWLSIETELNSNRSYLAWSNPNGYVHVIGLDVNGNFNGIIQNYYITGAKGIEFNLSVSPYLFVSGTNGITRITISNQTVTNFSSAPYDLSNSQLEYGKNNKIYGISNTALGGVQLVGFLQNNTFSAITAGFNSWYDDNSPLTNFYTLPDQIDGEDYNDFFGIDQVIVSSFAINGDVPISICDEGTFTTFCQNQAMIFSANYSQGSVSAYKFNIQSVTSACDILTGSEYINYTGNWVNGTPSPSLDLRTLTDINGHNLSNTGGLAKITYTVIDACGNTSAISKVVRMYVSLQPSIALEIYNMNSPQNYLQPSHLISSPIQVGTASIGFRINNSTGTITSYTVIIDEVSSSGRFIKNIYNQSKNVLGVSNLTYENLNNYCVNSTIWSPYSGFTSCTSPTYNGYTGYFSYSNGLLTYNKYYKLTVTVSNICSSSTNYSYLYVSSIGNKTVVAEIAEGTMKTEDVFQITPNPASDFLYLSNLKEGKSKIEIFDLTGRNLITKFLSEKDKMIDVTSLRAGTYVCIYTSGEDKFSRLFMKN